MLDLNVVGDWWVGFAQIAVKTAAFDKFHNNQNWLFFYTDADKSDNVRM